MDADANLKDMNLNDVRATLMADLERACIAADELYRRGAMRYSDHKRIIEALEFLDNFLWFEAFLEGEE